MWGEQRNEEGLVSEPEEGTAVPREAGLPDAHGPVEAPRPPGECQGRSEWGPRDSCAVNYSQSLQGELTQPVPSIPPGQFINVPFHFPLIP